MCLYEVQGSTSGGPLSILGPDKGSQQCPPLTDRDMTPLH